MGKSSKIDTMIPITLIHIKMAKDSELLQAIDSSLNAMLYVFKGKIKVENKLAVRSKPLPSGLGVKQQIEDGELAIMSEGEKISITSEEDSEFLILAGPEIDEPVARYGPFVMNTMEEINLAFSDYQNGTFVNP